MLEQTARLDREKIDEIRLENREAEIVFHGLLGLIHQLRTQNTPRGTLRRQSDAVQNHLRAKWPGERQLTILLPTDSVVFDNDYHVISKGASGVFTADTFSRIDHIGAVFSNRESGQWARFSDVNSGQFKFIDGATHGLPDYE